MRLGPRSSEPTGDQSLETSSVSANGGKRCATRRFPRSPPTVDGEVRRSFGVLGDGGDLPAQAYACGGQGSHYWHGRADRWFASVPDAGVAVVELGDGACAGECGLAAAQPCRAPRTGWDRSRAGIGAGIRDGRGCRGFSAAGHGDRLVVPCSGPVRGSRGGRVAVCSARVDHGPRLAAGWGVDGLGGQLSGGCPLWGRWVSPFVVPRRPVALASLRPRATPR